MKKLIISFLAIAFLLGGGVVYAFRDDGNPHQLRASGATDADPVRIYQLVRYAEDGANSVKLTAGDVVVWDCVSDDGISVNIYSAVQSVDAVAGVVVSPEIPTADNTAGTSAVSDLGHRNWGYIQVYGYCAKVNMQSGSAVVGSAIIASGTVAREGTAVGGAFHRILGFAYDASEEGQTSDVFVTTSGT